MESRAPIQTRDARPRATSPRTARTIRRQAHDRGGVVGSSALAANSPSGPDARFGDKASLLGSSVAMPPHRPGRARRRAVLAALAIGLIFAWRLSSAPIVDPTAASPDSATCATRTRGDPARAAPMKLDLASDPVASDDDKFTVVLNTFRRRDMLVRSIRHYASCAHHIGREGPTACAACALPCTWLSSSHVSRSCSSAQPMASRE